MRRVSLIFGKCSIDGHFIPFVLSSSDGKRSFLSVPPCDKFRLQAVSVRIPGRWNFRKVTGMFWFLSVDPKKTEENHLVIVTKILASKMQSYLSF